MLEFVKQFLTVVCLDCFLGRDKDKINPLIGEHKSLEYNFL